MKTHEELLAELVVEKAELEYRLAEAQQKIRNAQVSDTADATTITDKDLQYIENDDELEDLQTKAVAAAKVFMESHDDFEASLENWEAITSFVKRKSLDPTKVKSYKLAYEALKKANALVEPAVTLAQIEKMNSKQFQERLKDRAFAEQAEKLLGSKRG